ncbi:hypothetical protein OEZ85_009297 [Tetradesmus obliquus]|uniref:Uncharacterized protein n=1 Tax=Tetradesmus obliquus TaxID=3088 RepID=A0ABY8U8I9_TETOB|nr:hypothetical protein OEZ85_009297 [Tetradesmus obliquus]
MGQTTSSALLSPDDWGSFYAGGGGSRVLQQASKGRLDLRELHPLLLLYTSHSGHSIVHVLAREGHADLLQEFVELLQQHAAELAEAVSSRLQEEDAKQAVSWWKPSQVLPWPRGPGDQVQQLQQPSLLVPTLLSWQNSKGVTPLMLACRAGHAACVAALLDHGADPLLLCKATRRSCLHYAAAAGHVSCVNVLLNEFRTLRVQQSNGSSSLVPLQAARVRDGVEGYTKFVDLRTTTGFSALHYTAFWGHTAVVRALLTGGASVMLQTANGGRGSTELLVDGGSNALHLCAENGHVMVAATLLMAHAEAMAQRYAAPLQQQQQQRQQQQQPWEGRGRQDPRAACNSTGRTPGALALAARRSKALLLLLDPALPLSWVLTSAGLMGSRLFGAPKLAVLAKAALDKHLVSCLDRLEQGVAGFLPV